MIRRTLLVVLVSTGLAGCMPAVQDGLPNSAISWAEMSDAEKLALGLRRANAGFANGDDTMLKSGLSMIRASGGRPLDGDGQAELNLWTAKASEIPVPLRGRTLGPGYRAGVLAGGVDTEIAQTFLAGKSASIALTSTNGEKLDLRVLDGSAKSVCRNQPSAMNCRWTPLFTQRHRIFVSNPGRKTVRYYLVID